MGGSTAGGGNASPVTSSKRDYKGFVAGVFSGIAKLSGMSFFQKSLLTVLWSVGYCDARS